MYMPDYLYRPFKYCRTCLYHQPVAASPPLDPLDSACPVPIPMGDPRNEQLHEYARAMVAGDLERAQGFNGHGRPSREPIR
jgi:hypothetical protein